MRDGAAILQGPEKAGSSFLPLGPVVDPPSITVNNGVDQVQVKEDGSVDVPVKASLNDNDSADAYITVTVMGFDPSWGTITVPVGTFSPDGTSWSVTLPAGQDLDTVFTFTPVAQSDVDLTGLVATVVATEPVTGSTASANDSFDVIVDAVADVPEVEGKDSSGVEGSALDVDIIGSLGDDKDGSESITHYQISDVPSEVTFNQGTNMGGGVWEFTPDELVGLQATHSDPAFDGSIGLGVTIFTKETPSDGEYDLSDNTNSATDQFTLTWTPTIDPPVIDVNNGASDVQVKEDGSVDVPVVVTRAPNAEPAEYLEITITGFDPSWGAVSAQDGVFSADGTSWSITLPAGADLNTAFTFTPAAQSDVDLTGLVVTAVVSDPIEGTSDSATANFNVIVDAVADKPEIEATDGSAKEGTPIDIHLSGTLGDDNFDGSESITHYQISNVPAGFSFTQGEFLGNGVWKFTPAEIVGLQMISDDSDFYGSLDLVATVFVEDAPSDGEYDESDNVNSASTGLTVTWLENDVPEVKDTASEIDESNLVPAGTAVNGAITADFGRDGPGNFTANGSFNSDVALTSGGQAVIVSSTATGYVGKVAGGDTIFTLTLNADGSYQFLLTGTLDHPDQSDHNDAIKLDFGVNAEDSDADIGSGTISITVLDDGVTAHDDVNLVKENVGFTTGNVITGENGGAGAADDLSQDGPNLVTTVSFGGIDYDVPVTGTVIVNGEFGQLEIAADGSYTYTLNSAGGGVGGGETQHSFTGNPGTFPDMNEGKPLDANGKKALGIADGDLDVVEGSKITMVYRGEGADYHNTLGAFTVAADGTLQHGSILIKNVETQKPDTEFEYVAGANAASAGFFLIAQGWTENNSYSGIDLSAGSIRFVYNYGTAGARDATVNDNGSNISLVHVAVNGKETVLSGHVYYTTPADNGKLNADGKVHVVSDLAVEGEDGVLRIGFEDIYGLGDKDYNDAYFDVSITSPSLDDCNCGPGTDQFIYTLTDGDGDSSLATLTLECQENDTPIITKIEHGVVDESDLAPVTEVSGVVVAEFGLDADGSAFSASGQTTLPPSLTSNGKAVTIALSGNTYIGSTQDGDVFKMEIKADGSYTFTLLDTLDHPDVTDHNDALALSFGVKATDGDGDAVNAMVTIDVLDDGVTAHDDVNTYNVSENGKDYNVVLMLDISGSMAGNKLTILKNSVKNMLTEYHEYSGGEVKVFITPFHTTSLASRSFDVSTKAGYNAAVNFVNGFRTAGYTNYEAPLNTAINWLENGDTISGAETYSYFISDGIPNRYQNDKGGTVKGNSARVMNEIQGISDKTDEVGMLKALSTKVYSVGISVGANALKILDVIDSDGQALDVRNPSDLDAVLNGTSFIGSTSGNVITGENGGSGAADDLSQDAPNVVTHIAFGGIIQEVDPVHGASIKGEYGTLNIKADGSYNYSLSKMPENDASDPSPAPMPSDEFTYTLTDGDGDTSTATLLLQGTTTNVINGTDGADTIVATPDVDILYGNAGADNFVFEAIGKGVDVIRDFNIDEGDVLDLSGMLESANTDHLQNAINDFVFSREVDGGTVLSVDIGGSGDAGNAVDFVALENVYDVDIAQLVASANLNVIA